MAEETAYEKYLHADKILSFQKKDDELVCDGERDFQGVQQEAELIWTRVNFILKRTHERMGKGDLHEAAHLLEQAASLWSGLTAKSEELLFPKLWGSLNELYKDVKTERGESRHRFRLDANLLSA